MPWEQMIMACGPAWISVLRPDSEWLAREVEVLQWGRMRDVTIMDKLRQLLPGALFGADDRRWWAVVGCGVRREP
jgi:hypothetical protein